MSSEQYTRNPTTKKNSIIIKDTFPYKFALILVLLSISLSTPLSEALPRGPQNIVNGKDGPSSAELLTCIRRWKVKNPKLTLRFSDPQIEFLCKASDLWLKKAEEEPEFYADDLVTRRQKDWLNNLRTCSGKDCLQDAVKQRCRGRRCRVSMERANSDGTQGGGGTQVAKDPEPTFNERFSLVQLRDINPNKMMKTMDAESGMTADDLVAGSQSDSCRNKVWLSEACPQILDKKSYDQVFPEVAEAAGSDRRQAMKNRKKYRNIKQKCNQIKNKLRRSRASFMSLAKCSNAQLLQRQRQTKAAECVRVLGAGTAQNAFPDESATPRRQLQQKYNKAKRACSTLQNKLMEAGQSFDDWTSGGSAAGLMADAMPTERSRSRPRQGGRRRGNVFDRFNRNKNTPQPVPQQQRPQLMFDDIENVDFRAERREIRMMTDDQRIRFQDAMNRLKTDMIDRTSKYDLLVIYHTPQESPGAHWGPAFLPFHRELLKQLEVALRQVDPTVSLPYWDSTLDQGLPTPKDSILWTPDFFGNGDGEVITGPFANWTTTHELSFVPGMRKLFRGVGDSPYGGLFKPADIEFVKTREHFDELTACVDPTFELVHGLAHMFVGGFMADIGISPNDPTFFMHHNFIDSLWEDWRLDKQTLEQRDTQYPSDEKACNNFHYKDSIMRPFSIKNGDGLSNDYTRNLYYHADKPSCSAAEPDCGSKYLFCDTGNNRCLSKVIVGGDCTGFEGTPICYNGQCSAGVCQPATDNPITQPPVATTTTSTTTTTTQLPDPIEECTETMPCGDGLFCDLAERLCEVQIQLGRDCFDYRQNPDVCEGSAECTDGGICQLPTTTAPPTTTTTTTTQNPRFCSNAVPCTIPDTFCDAEFNECIDQIDIGDNCQGFEDLNPCKEGGACLEGMCTAAGIKENEVDVGTTEPPTGSCTTSAECGAGEFCDVLYRTCTSRIAVDEDCDGLEEMTDACADGATCVEGVCTAEDDTGTTAKPMGTGEEDGDEEPTQCASDADCSGSDFCDIEYAVCGERLKEGESCEDLEEYPRACDEGLTCQNQICQLPGTGGSKNIGDECMSESDDCGPDGFCDTEIRQCISKLNIGDDCADYEGLPVCRDGGECFNGVCTSQTSPVETTTTSEPPLSSTCDGNDQCTSAEFCDIEVNECTGKIPIAGDCSGYEGEAEVCQNNGVCQQGMCVDEPEETLTTTTTTLPPPPETTTPEEENLSECDADSDCLAEQFCDMEYKECVDTVNIGGNCAGFEGLPVCKENGNCVSGICQALTPITTTTTRRPTTTTTRAPITTTTTSEVDCSAANPDCGEAAFCDVEYGSCVDMVDIGGDCTGFEGLPICKNAGECMMGVCERDQTTTTTTTTTPIPTTTTTRRVIVTRPPTTTTTRRPPIPTTTADQKAGGGGSGGQLGDGEDEFPCVYFTVSVIRGNYNFYKQPVPGATIKTTGQNVPSGYTQTVEGKTHLNPAYPYYTGAAVVKVMDPEKAGYFPLVQAKVEVTDEMGRQCTPNCYQASKKQYIPCDNVIRLSPNTYYSDPIKFAKTEEAALEQLWDKSRYQRRRLPDYMMFQC